MPLRPRNMLAWLFSQLPRPCPASRKLGVKPSRAFVESDANISRMCHVGVAGVKFVRYGLVDLVLEKFPVMQWLPN